MNQKTSAVLEMELQEKIPCSVSVSRRALWESAPDSKLVASTNKQHSFPSLRSSVKRQRRGVILREGVIPPGQPGLEKAKGVLVNEPELRATCETAEQTNKITRLRVWLGERLVLTEIRAAS